MRLNSKILYSFQGLSKGYDRVIIAEYFFYYSPSNLTLGFGEVEVGG
jgi:hypothetical protein